MNEPRFEVPKGFCKRYVRAQLALDWSIHEGNVNDDWTVCRTAPVESFETNAATISSAATEDTSTRIAARSALCGRMPRR